MLSLHYRVDKSNLPCGYLKEKRNYGNLNIVNYFCKAPVYIKAVCDHV